MKLCACVYLYVKVVDQFESVHVYGVVKGCQVFITAGPL